MRLVFLLLIVLSTAGLQAQNRLSLSATGEGEYDLGPGRTELPNMENSEELGTLIDGELHEEVIIDLSGFKEDEELITRLNLHTYPVPAIDQVKFDLDMLQPGTGFLYILDINGRIMSSEDMRWKAGKTTQSIDMSNLPSGVYFIELDYEAGSLIGRTIKL
jgi:hypothetical protein